MVKMYFLIVLLSNIISVVSFKYLIISPVYGFSHMKYMAEIANLLANAGHEVTYFQPFVLEEYIDHKLIRNKTIQIFNYWHDDEGRRYMPAKQCLGDTWYSTMYQSDIGNAFLLPRYLYPAFEHMCRKIFQDHHLHRQLKSEKFDVVISEAFDFCGLYLADYLKFPAYISTFTGYRINAISPALGEPSFLNYLPAPYSKHGASATLVDRFWDIWYKIFSSYGFEKLFDMQYEQVRRVTNGEVRHWKDIINDVTYHFSNSNPYLDFVVPTISKVVDIGGVIIDTKHQHTKLSENMEKLLNLRKYTVLISFGSMIQSADMPVTYKNSMIQLFLANPNVTFLWKYEKNFGANIPENVYISNWFAQDTLLADKRINLFITHGGLGSTMELAYAGKPGIVIPLFADQPGNAKMIERHGSVEIYSKMDIPNFRKLSAIIQNMLKNTTYQRNANRLADILHNQPISPQTLMLKYAENAAKFGKMPSITPYVKNMGVVEYYNLDLVVIFLMCIGGLVYFSTFLFIVKVRKIKVA